MNVFYRAIFLVGVFVGIATCCLEQTTVGADDEASNLLVNGDFEEGMEGWEPFWARDAAAGNAALDTDQPHGGLRAIRIEHTRDTDWCLTQSRQIPVAPGDVFELSAWVLVKGSGAVVPSVMTRDANGEFRDWIFGGRTAYETNGWRLVQGRFAIPKGIVSIQFRLVGFGRATVLADDLSLIRQGRLDSLSEEGLPETLSLQNESIELNFDTSKAVLAIRDKRSGRTCSQRAVGSSLVVRNAKLLENAMDVRLLDAATLNEISATIRLEADRPEAVVTLESSGNMEMSLVWPAPFASTKGEMLILPLNEGISYPVDDPTIPPVQFALYTGHGLCMPWYGATDGESGWMGLVETPDDAIVVVNRREELLELSPQWQPQRRQFGARRILRYVLFDKGGYVAMAKRYRAYAKETGLFKTLAEKRKAKPAIDRLVGAVNVWSWEPDAPAICGEMQSLGIQRILWSCEASPETIKALNALDVLTSRYDIYQDTMNPEQISKLRDFTPPWTSDAWNNDDLLTNEAGRWVPGWEVDAKDGSRIPCGIVCDRQVMPYAKSRIPAELKTHPYRCRFLDTTAASEWHECYHPKHPMTRTESKQNRIELLRYVSEECGLVCGSETGHDAAVPYVDYFEGMLSLILYRVPEAGRDMMRPWTEAPADLAKFQTGHFYRLPLWELVYHDCVVAQWYWGDYNNKLPSLWDRRDLWNALYGTPPMFMFDRTIWEANRERFVRSYKTATPVARATGYSEMLSHEWLTPDRTVQQTRFANGVVVTVNFGDAPYTFQDGRILTPLACDVARHRTRSQEVPTDTSDNND